MFCLNHFNSAIAEYCYNKIHYCGFTKKYRIRFRLKIKRTEHLRITGLVFHTKKKKKSAVIRYFFLGDTRETLLLRNHMART